MKYLTEVYWNALNTNQITKKGICFENLVEKMLIAEYGEMAFQGTKLSWDGSKDFYYYSRQKKYWAECKNYASNIDLKVLASTLIMAQLSEIDTILYYSYSPINVNAKAKLLLNADKKNKNIFFYDDIVLEQKIFQYWDFIGEDFFPKFTDKKIQFDKSEVNLETKCLIYGNPLDLATSIDGYEIEHLAVFKMFEMDICIINRENKSSKISFGFKKTEHIKTQFEIFPDYMFKSKTELSLLPYEGKSIRLWLIPIKENCTIPHPCINGRQINLPTNVEFKAMELRNRKRLIGKSYGQCLINFKQNILFETVKLKIGIFYGNSGTGKSKLLQECLNSSKISGYDIVDFRSLNNSKEILSVLDFIQKLFIAIYNISLDILEEIVKILTFQEKDDSLIKEQPEYRMLGDIFNVTNDTDMKNWIDQYLDIVILKLAKCKFLIAIDNVQFFDDSILDLVDSICTKLSITKPCNTKFLFTFNVDYIKKDSKASLLLSKYTSNDSIAYAEHITGFKNSEECYEFMQETFSIGEILGKTDIDYVAKNSNKNPFYLEQMIYWLQEKQALEQGENSYKIKNDILFNHLIRNIPNTVYDILSDRWNYYQKSGGSESEKTIILFSAIHLYKELTKKDIDELKISWEIVKELEWMGYVTIEDSFNTINVRFRHDLIDNYLSKMYPSFSAKIIEYENAMNIILRDNYTRYCFDILYSPKKETLLSNTQLSEILSLQIDSRLSYEFYLLVFEKVLATFEYNFSEDSVTCINNIYQVIIFIHDILGNDVMQKCVDRFLFKSKNVKELFAYSEYAQMLLYISEAFDSMGKYQEAIQLIKDYKEKVFGNQDEKLLSIEKQRLISQIYNRLHVYCRHLTAIPIENKDIMYYLNKSSNIADKIQDAVMQYVNYSDRGYLYYDLPLSDENHAKTIHYWKKACNIYEKGNAEAKYINYLRKKAQISLLEGNSEQAIRAVEKGLEELDLSPYAYQQTFFKWWFYHALAEACLLCYKDKNAEIVEKSLERAHFYSDLLESNKKFYYLQLKSVYMYYQGSCVDAIELNNEAKELLEFSNYKIKTNSIKEQLLENEIVFKSTMKESRRNLYSQIHTLDGLFNLPCM